MKHDPRSRQTQLMLLGGALCFALGAGTVLVFDSLRDSVRQSIKSDKPSRRADTQDLDSIPIQPLPQAPAPGSQAKAFPALPNPALSDKEAEDFVREAQAHGLLNG